MENLIEHGLSGNNRLYVRMREVGIENWEILPLLSRMCGKKEVYEVEKKWIGILKADLKLIKYRKANGEKIQDYFKKNIQRKQYYCSVCDLACRSNRDLKRHLHSLKHSYTWLNSLD